MTSIGQDLMGKESSFDFKKHWLNLPPEEREAFATEAGTTSHYIQTHLTGRRKMPGKALMDGLFKASKSREWVSNKAQLVAFFYE